LNEKRVIVGSRQLAATSGVAVPAVIQNAGADAIRRFVEFFTANIRNANTRMAYMRAIRRFCSWADDRELSLANVEPVMVASYVELLCTTYNSKLYARFLAFRVLMVCVSRLLNRVCKLIFSILLNLI
jgi:hypothetical protein